MTISVSIYVSLPGSVSGVFFGCSLRSLTVWPFLMGSSSVYSLGGSTGGLSFSVSPLSCGWFASSYVVSLWISWLFLDSFGSFLDSAGLSLWSLIVFSLTSLWSLLFLSIRVAGSSGSFAKSMMLPCSAGSWMFSFLLWFMWGSLV